MFIRNPGRLKGAATGLAVVLALTGPSCSARA
jgi:hypothetical protein